MKLPRDPRRETTEVILASLQRANEQIEVMRNRELEYLGIFTWLMNELDRAGAGHLITN
jgi:hypothetical protein